MCTEGSSTQVACLEVKCLGICGLSVYPQTQQNYAIRFLCFISAFKCIKARELTWGLRPAGRQGCHGHAFRVGDTVFIRIPSESLRFTPSD